MIFVNILDWESCVMLTANRHTAQYRDRGILERSNHLQGNMRRVSPLCKTDCIKEITTWVWETLYKAVCFISVLCPNLLGIGGCTASATLLLALQLLYRNDVKDVLLTHPPPPPPPPPYVLYNNVTLLTPFLLS